jgi:hypothetical protein
MFSVISKTLYQNVHSIKDLQLNSQEIFPSPPTRRASAGAQRCACHPSPLAQMSPKMRRLFRHFTNQIQGNLRQPHKLERPCSKKLGRPCPTNFAPKNTKIFVDIAVFVGPVLKKLRFRAGPGSAGFWPCFARPARFIGLNYGEFRGLTAKLCDIELQWLPSPEGRNAHSRNFASSHYA